MFTFSFLKSPNPTFPPLCKKLLHPACSVTPSIYLIRIKNSRTCHSVPDTLNLAIQIHLQPRTLQAYIKPHSIPTQSPSTTRSRCSSHSPTPAHTPSIRRDETRRDGNVSLADIPLPFPLPSFTSRVRSRDRWRLFSH